MKEWEPKIKEMIPSYGMSLAENPELFQEIHTSTAGTLGLSEKEQFIVNFILYKKNLRSLGLKVLFFVIKSNFLIQLTDALLR